MAYEMPKKRIMCNDGFSMSVQANEYVYCEPRMTGLGFYSKYEVGFPSEEEPLLTEFAEDPFNLTGTVYPYVPVEIIAQIVVKHGGVKGVDEWK